MNASHRLAARCIWLATFYRIVAVIAAFMPFWARAAGGDGFDPHGTRSGLATPPIVSSVQAVTGIAACEFSPLDGPLRLEDVAARALCRSPSTRRAWADARVRAARLGEAQAAQWPTLSANLSDSLNAVTVSSANASSGRESYRGMARAAELAFEWVVFDSGARSAEVSKARALMIAASQSLNSSVLNVLHQSARDYFTAIAAQAQAKAADEAQANATLSLAAAAAQTHSGVASIVDELQARTAHDQSVLGAIKAHGALREAIGTLAVNVGLSPDVPIELPDMPMTVQSGTSELDGIRTLLDQAFENHPRILAVRAELQASKASEVSVRARALPSVRLEAGFSGSNRPTASIDVDRGASSAARSRYVGIRVTIPIFDGFASTYRLREARAQIELQEASVAEAEQQVALNVWKSYEAARAGAQAMKQMEALNENAALAFDAAQARYRAGIASIIELLRAQDALAAARNQRITTLSDLYVTRLGLAASLGQLDLGQMQNGQQ